jgi:hypothetical protein
MYDSGDGDVAASHTIDDAIAVNESLAKTGFVRLGDYAASQRELAYTLSNCDYSSHYG